METITKVLLGAGIGAAAGLGVDALFGGGIAEVLLDNADKLDGVDKIGGIIPGLASTDPSLVIEAGKTPEAIIGSALNNGVQLSENAIKALQLSNDSLTFAQWSEQLKDPNIQAGVRELSESVKSATGITGVFSKGVPGVSLSPATYDYIRPATDGLLAMDVSAVKPAQLTQLGIDPDHLGKFLTETQSNPGFAWTADPAKVDNFSRVIYGLAADQPTATIEKLGNFAAKHKALVGAGAGSTIAAILASRGENPEQQSWQDRAVASSEQNTGYQVPVR